MGYLFLIGKIMLKITFHNTADKSFYEPLTGITIGIGDTTLTNIKDSKLTDINKSIQKMNASNSFNYVSLSYEQVALSKTITPNAKGIILDELDTVNVSVSLSSDLFAENNQWSVSDDSVLSIDSNGNNATITALKESNSCSVIVKNGDTRAFFNIKIYPKLNGMTITPSDKNIGLGSTYQFSLSPIPSTARILNPIWSSSDTSVASVNSGLVKASGLGSCNVSASYNGISVSSKIDVTDKYSAYFSETTKSISVGETYNTVLNVNKNDTAYTNMNPKYISSDNSIASVDSSGKVTGLNSGKVVITAYEDSKYSTFTEISVNVVNIASISLSPATLNLYAGNEQTLSSVILPNNATNKNILYKSDNTDVATVTNLGKITAKNVGTATISATASDGSLVTASSSVNVLETQVSSIAMNYSTQTLVVGSTLQLVATISPNTATNKTIAWSSTNSNCAVVDNYGLVTAVGSGNATIVATSNEGRKSAICVVTVNSKS